MRWLNYLVAIGWIFTVSCCSFCFFDIPVVGNDVHTIHTLERRLRKSKKWIRSRTACAAHGHCSSVEMSNTIPFNIRSRSNDVEFSCGWSNFQWLSIVIYCFRCRYRSSIQTYWSYSFLGFPPIIHINKCIECIEYFSAINLYWWIYLQSNEKDCHFLYCFRNRNDAQSTRLWNLRRTNEMIHGIERTVKTDIWACSCVCATFPMFLRHFNVEVWGQWDKKAEQAQGDRIKRIENQRKSCFW